jgi:hypothetical protein
MKLGAQWTLGAHGTVSNLQLRATNPKFQGGQCKAKSGWEPHLLIPRHLCDGLAAHVRPLLDAVAQEHWVRYLHHRVVHAVLGQVLDATTLHVTERARRLFNEHGHDTVVGILIVGYKPLIHERKGILSHESGKSED